MLSVQLPHSPDLSTLRHICQGVVAIQVDVGLCDRPLNASRALATSSAAGLLAARRQGTWSQFAFAAHYIHHVNRFTLLPIEYSARRFKNLTVAAAGLSIT
jgi:hypothetical protein